jgi:hypothetical protein
MMPRHKSVDWPEAGEGAAASCCSHRTGSLITSTRTLFAFLSRRGIAIALARDAAERAHASAGVEVTTPIALGSLANRDLTARSAGVDIRLEGVFDTDLATASIG